MTINEDQEETLTFIKEHFDRGNVGVLSDWERSFMRDQLSRWDEYGIETRFSPKQWNIIEKVEMALTTGNPSRGRR